MDCLEYQIYCQALWSIPAMLSVIDLDAMVREARDRGAESDLELILALRMIKGEEHQP
jgi:hypothetical protein